MNYYPGTSYLIHRETDVVLIWSKKLAEHPMMMPFVPPPQAPEPTGGIIPPAPAVQPPPTPIIQPPATALETMAPLQTLNIAQINRLTKPAVMAYLGTAYDEAARFLTNKATLKKMWKEQTG